MTTVIVITGATPLHRRAVEAVTDLIEAGTVGATGAVGATAAGETLVLAADGGLDHALAAGLEPAQLVGDLDSVSAGGLAWAAEHAEVVRHPVDKAATDTELAVAHGAATGPDRLLLVAGAGGRMDHAVAAVGALGNPALAGIGRLEAWWGGDRFHVVHGPRQIVVDRDVGATFSVLAMHGPCRGVTVAGARWPLCDHDLGPLVGLGISNVAVEAPLTVGVRAGVLTVVFPEEGC